MQEFERVACNADVVKRLEQYLSDARQGHINFVGLVAVAGTKHTLDFVGDTRALEVAHMAATRLTKRLFEAYEASIAQQHKKPIDGRPDMWLYDITEEPTNFDFVVWLATVELQRRLAHAEGPLRIGFRAKDDRAFRSQADIDNRNKFFVNVMGPALDFFGAVGDPEAVSKGKRSDVYTLRALSKAARDGIPIPRIMVPDYAMATVATKFKGQRPPVTITLRRSGTWEHRNSNREAWLRFAKELQNLGEKVIIVQDTADAHEPISGFEIYPMASEDLHIRAALYEQARCNLFVANGPASLAYLGSAPYMIFLRVTEDEHEYCNTTKWWTEHQGVSPGEQFPWALPTQRLVWADDTFENLLAAWNEQKELLDGTLEVA